MLKEIRQLKGEKVGLEALLVQSQADLYKMGYVNHLFGRLSTFEFARRNFETFSISPKDLIAFTFEASIGEVVKDVDAQAGAVRGEMPDGTTAENVTAAEGVATTK
ncbi:hypothetical protein ACFX1Z_007102 [Malus domestica]